MVGGGAVPGGAGERQPRARTAMRRVRMKNSSAVSPEAISLAPMRLRADAMRRAPREARSLAVGCSGGKASACNTIDIRHQ